MGRIYRAYTDIQIKAFVDGYRASGSSLRSFAKGINVPERSLRRWLGNVEAELPARQKKHINSPVYPHVETALCAFIRERRLLGLGVTNPEVKRKALEIVDENQIVKFSVSDGCITLFKKRNAWVYRVPTKKARKAHFTDEDLMAEEEYFTKLVEHIYVNRTPNDRVFNFDQTMIRLVSPQPKTISPKGAMEVMVRHPDGEKDGIAIALTIRADGGKYPAIVVFKAGRKGVLSDNIMSKLNAPANVVIWSAPSTWWTEKLDHAYISSTFPENQENKVLIRDQLPVHKLKSCAELLEKRNVVPISVPAGRTGDYQPLDVGVNKPFKAYYRAEYEAWRNVHNEITPKGYLKKPGRQDFVNMISVSWDKVTPDCVRNSFVGARVTAADLDLVEPEMQQEDEADSSAIDISVFSASLIEDEENDVPMEYGNRLPL